MRTLTVDKPTALLDFLGTQFPDSPKTRLRKLLKFRSIRVNGSPATRHDHPLAAGDKVEILGREAAARERIAPRLGFPILYEDDAIIVIDKPSGLLTMGTEKEKERTAYFELTAYVRASTKNGRGRIFIVHRLDQDTSGVVAFAKTALAKSTLQENWEQAEKSYAAVVEGVPSQPAGRIESNLVEDKFRRVYSLANKARYTKTAVTEYRVTASNGRYALLAIHPRTGRKNQIRVHLSDLGHPVAGDRKYGAKTDPIGRLALHSWHLSFPHPVDGRPMHFEAAPPREFARTVSR